MKLLLVILILSRCGVDDSAGQAPSPSASPSVETQPSPTIAASKSDNSKSGIGPVVSSNPVASVQPSPSPAPLALGLVTSQPFETNDWVYDFRSLNYAINAAGDSVYTSGSSASYKKTAGGTLTCWMRTQITITPGDEWGLLTFTQISGSQTPGCWAAGETYRAYWFKIKSCQGYSQSTYICGQTQSIVYDLYTM